MEKEIIIFDQLELIVNLINKAKLSNYRISLILIDNLVELFLYTTCIENLEFDKFVAKTYYIDPHAPDKIKSIQESLFSKIKEKNEADFDFLEIRKHNDVLRYFDRKIHYLSSTKKILNHDLGIAIKCLHEYRNECYHSDEIREDIIKPIVLVYFKLAVMTFKQLGNIQIPRPISKRILDYENIFNVNFD